MFYGQTPYSFLPSGYLRNPMLGYGFNPSVYPMLPAAFSHLPGFIPQTVAPFYPQPQQANALASVQGENAVLSQKIDLLLQQMNYLTELVSRNAFATQPNVYGLPQPPAYRPAFAVNTPWGHPGFVPPFGSVPPTTGFIPGTHGFPNGTPGPVGMSYEHSPIRIRETESYLCWEIPFQNLSINDVEVEVLGNRIVCRTKTAIHPTNRFWLWSALPAGIQVFELPDGRVECSLALPIAFDSKEVEAVFKDGCIAIYIPKIEATERQTVRVGKEAPQYVTGTGSSRKNAQASQLS